MKSEIETALNMLQTGYNFTFKMSNSFWVFYNLKIEEKK